MLGIIYKHTNKINGKYYVGQRVQYVKKNGIKIPITPQEALEKRWKKHVWDSKQENPHCYFHKTIKKYGEQNFINEILEENINEELLNDREIFYIAKWGACDKRYGYNMTEGGKSGSPNEETCKKLSESLKGKPKSEEHRKNLSKSGKGRKLSEEAKQNMSKAQKDKKRKPLSEEHKQKISENHADISGDKNPMFGKKLSQESIKKRTESRRRNKELKKLITKFANCSQSSILKMYVWI